MRFLFIQICSPRIRDSVIDHRLISASLTMNSRSCRITQRKSKAALLRPGRIHKLLLNISRDKLWRFKVQRGTVTSPTMLQICCCFRVLVSKIIYNCNNISITKTPIAAPLASATLAPDMVAERRNKPQGQEFWKRHLQNASSEMNFSFLLKVRSRYL